MSFKRPFASGAPDGSTVFAGIGLGVAFCALEAWRYPVYGSVAGASLPINSNLVAILVLLLCCVFYMVSRRRIAHHNWFAALIAILASSSLLCYCLTSADGTAWTPVRYIAGLHMGTAVLLFLMWMEELLSMPDGKSLDVMVIGLASTFFIQAAILVIDRSSIWMVCASLPMLSGLLFVLHRRSPLVSLALAAPKSKHCEQETSLGVGFAASIAPALAETLTCGIVFGLLNAAWRTSDASLGNESLIQFNSALGALAASLVLALFARPVKRGHLEMLVVVFALAALLLESVAPVFPVAFLIPLNIAQKLMFALFLIVAQDFDDKSARRFALAAAFLAYRTGLYMQSSIKEFMTGTLSVESTASTGILVSVGCIAMVVLATYRLISSNTEAASETQAEPIAYYRSLAFNFYLSQRFGLTQRESEIVTLLAEESDSASIARELQISQSTVKTHLHNVYVKADVHSQAELEALVHAERKMFFDLSSPDASAQTHTGSA